MKKMVYILSLALSFNTYAEIMTGDKCGDNCTWTFDTETGKLTVSGTGEMYDLHWSYNNNLERYQTGAPWKNYDWDITQVEIKNGITSIGADAFYNLANLENVSIADSVTKMGGGCFQGDRNLISLDLPKNLEVLSGLANTSIKNLVVPESVTSFDPYSVGSEQLEKLIIESDINFEKDVFWRGGSREIPTTLTSVYCTHSNESCQTLADDTQLSSKMIFFSKEDGVYQLTDKNGSPIADSYYISATDMVSGVDKTCGTDLNVCKAKVLENKGICDSTACMALVEAANNGQFLKVASKTYQSLNALLKGDYDKRRIYTIEEANFVAGDKNRVSIKYR